MIALATAFLIAANADPIISPKNEPIQLVVLVILATDQNSDINERLKEIAAEIRKKEPLLTGFELHKTFNKNLKLGEQLSIELIGRAMADLMINEKTDDEGRMTVTVKPPKLDEITYACTCGKFFPIITNHYTADKQRLIIAIMAKPCKKK